MKRTDSGHGSAGLTILEIGSILVIICVSVILSKRVSWGAYMPGIMMLSIAAVVLGFGRARRKSNGPRAKTLSDKGLVFDPARHEAVIRSSICTGEKVAGWKDRENGHFTEVAVIKSEEDRRYFMKTYGISDIKTEY